KSGRAGGIAYEPGKRRRSLHRRDPSAATDDRRISLSSDGRLPPRHHYRSGTTSPESAITTAEVHASRRNDAGRDGERATALAMLEIDRDGFDQWDKRIIETLIHKFNGGPVGLNSLAVAIGEEAGTLEEVNEPYLIMEGYIKRTPQGRVATANAYKKLGLKPPAGMQGELL